MIEHNPGIQFGCIRQFNNELQVRNKYKYIIINSDSLMTIYQLKVADIINRKCL